MTHYMMQIGQPHTNLHQLLLDSSLSNGSPIEKVMPADVIKLLQENKTLEPTSCEKWRAKVISHIIGGALPLLITGLCAAAFYALYVTGAAYFLYSKAVTTIVPLAQSLFTTITQNAASMAISGGSVVVAGVILTRPTVYEAIGAFFASCCGSCCGTVAGAGVVAFISDIHGIGYNWWYNKYQFTHREDKIKENKASVINILKNTYNDMADNVKDLLNKDKATPAELNDLKKQATELHKKLTTIQHIFTTQGLANNDYEEITLNLDKELNAVIGYTKESEGSTL